MSDIEMERDSLIRLDTPASKRAHKLMLSDKFRSMVEAMPHVIVWGTDLNGKIAFSFGGGLASLSLTARSVEGIEVNSAPLDIHIKHRQGLLGVGGVTQDKEARSGQIFNSAYSPYYDDDGKIAGTVVLSINITHFQDSNDKQLRETLTKLQEIVNQAILPLNQMSRMERFFTWFGVKFEATVKWAAPYAAKAVTIALTALALWIAQRLGVLDRILKMP